MLLVIPATVPVKVGEANGAFKSNADWAKMETGLLASVVLSTLAKSTMLLVIPATIPVKVGESNRAFSANEFVTSIVFALRAKPGTVGATAVPAKSPAN